MSSSGGSITHFRSSDRVAWLTLQSSYPHGRLLLSRAKRELAAIERLAGLSATMPLTNDAWRMLLRILVDTLQGRLVTVRGLARDLALSPDITRRYLRSLESEKLVLVVEARSPVTACDATEREADPNEGRVTIGDEGILRIARFFLPAAANE